MNKKAAMPCCDSCIHSRATPYNDIRCYERIPYLLNGLDGRCLEGRKYSPRKPISNTNLEDKR